MGHAYIGSKAVSSSTPCFIPFSRDLVTHTVHREDRIDFRLTFQSRDIRSLIAIFLFTLVLFVLSCPSKMTSNK